jgi:hypothetical protein
VSGVTLITSKLATPVPTRGSSTAPPRSNTMHLCLPPECGY